MESGSRTTGLPTVIVPQLKHFCRTHRFITATIDQMRLNMVKPLFFVKHRFACRGYVLKDTNWCGRNRRSYRYITTSAQWAPTCSQWRVSQQFCGGFRSQEFECTTYFFVEIIPLSIINPNSRSSFINNSLFSIFNVANVNRSSLWWVRSSEETNSWHP